MLKRSRLGSSIGRAALRSLSCGLSLTIGLLSAVLLLAVGDGRPALAASPARPLAIGPRCGTPAVSDVRGAAAVAAPTITSAGGFAGYRPVDTILPRSSVVIELGR